MKTKNLILPLFLFISFFILINHLQAAPNPTYVYNPYESLGKECPMGEQKVSCTNGQNLLLSLDQCKKFSTNPRYSFLGNEVENRSVYCYKPMSVEQMVVAYSDLMSGFLTNKLALMLLITLLIELPVFFIFDFRTKRHFNNILFVNFISVPLALLTLVFSSYSGLLVLLTISIFVIMFEAATLIVFNKGLDYMRIIKTSFTANVLSTLLGQFIVFYIV